MDERETGWDHIYGNKFATFFTSEKKYLKQILSLKEQYPDEVEIIAENEDGSICCHIPAEWLRIRPKKKTNLTPEQIAAASERLKQYRMAQSSNA